MSHDPVDLAAIRRARDLPQSAKRYAEWLSRRPVRGSDELFRGGQQEAVADLGLGMRSVQRAEAILTVKGYLVRVQRGTRYSTYSRFKFAVDARRR